MSDYNVTVDTTYESYISDVSITVSPEATRIVTRGEMFISLFPKITPIYTELAVTLHALSRITWFVWVYLLAARAAGIRAEWSTYTRLLFNTIKKFLQEKNTYFFIPCKTGIALAIAVLRRIKKYLYFFVIILYLIFLSDWLIS